MEEAARQLIGERIAERAAEESDDLAWAKPYVDEAMADVAPGCHQPGRASYPQLCPTCSPQGLMTRVIIAATADADTQDAKWRVTQFIGEEHANDLSVRPEPCNTGLRKN